MKRKLLFGTTPEEGLEPPTRGLTALRPACPGVSTNVEQRLKRSPICPPVPVDGYRKCIRDVVAGSGLHLGCRTGRWRANSASRRDPLASLISREVGDAFVVIEPHVPRPVGCENLPSLPDESSLRREHGDERSARFS